MNKIISRASGVYQLCNMQNNKIYVGSAVNLHWRSTHHFNALNRGDHCSRHLQLSFNKYGAEYFTFSVLEYCEKERLIEREQFYIDLLKPEYNTLPIAGSCLGVKRSDETRARMSASLKGRVISQEAREKTRITLTGRKDSAEVKHNKGVSHYKPVAQYTEDGTFIKVFKSLREAAKIIGVVSSQITACCQMRFGHKTAAGYQLRYFDGNTKNIDPVGPICHPNHRVAVSQYSKDGIYVATYEGIREAAKANGMGETHVSSCCRGIRKTAGGYMWEYAS